MSPARTDPFIGRVIGGQYRIDSKLGEGGMGAVYRATQLAVNRGVAVKVLRAHVPEMEKGALVQRFRREAMATSKLRHPNTVSVYDFGETEDGTMYMVLELLDGATLSEVVTRHAPLPPERVAYIGKQIAKSLAEAHECGIVHRDLKPDNVFVCHYHGDPDFTKVMDFGIARLLTGDDGRDVTRTGMMVGTPRYIAPEQAMAKKVTPAADLYALGVILFEMLSGSAPFDEESAMALALAHINEPVPPLELAKYPKPLAEAWQGLVQSLLTKNPKKRPQRAAEVANWLSQLELDARRWRDEGRSGRWTVSAASPAGAPPNTYEGPSPKSTVTVSAAIPAVSSTTWVAVAAVLFMALGGLVAFLLLGDEPAPAPPPTTRPAGGVIEEPVPRPAEPAPSAADPRVAPREPAAVAAPPEPVERPEPEAVPPPEAAVELPTMDARPEPEPVEAARLVLTSRPVGALVRIGAERICTTPCDVDLDSADRGTRVKLRFSRRGYKDSTVSAALTPGKTFQRRVTLVRKSDREAAGE